MSVKTAETTATLRVTRLIKAPRERVFAAWTTPADLLKWLGPETCRATSAKLDLREGGRYQYQIKSDQGDLQVNGTFREVKPPSRLDYTWAWSGNPAMEFGETLVTVEFIDRNGATEVQLTHDKLPDAEQRDGHNHGWNGSLDKLEALLAGGGEGGCAAVGTFAWNELVTNDVSAAGKFYTGLFGWQTEDFPGSDVGYKLFKSAGAPVGGLMKCPNGKAPPMWLAYVAVENVDASAAQAVKLGGAVCVPAFDVPDVGRIAVLQDPQGAAFGLFQPTRR